MSNIQGAEPVRKGHELNLSSLEQWLSKNTSTTIKISRVLQFKSGQSNPTFYLEFSNGSEYVLRKKPSGNLLPSAHAVEREYTVLKALQNSPVPVPKVIALCTESSVIGTPFYVMNYIRGRMFADNTLPDLSPQQRTEIYTEMARALAALHSVSFQAVGLGSFGKVGQYCERQIRRWEDQYQKSKTHDIPSMDKLVSWLKEHTPANQTTSIVHGDFRLDNMIWHPTQPKILAILDWELATLGDPLSDLGYNCMPYFLPKIGTEATAYSGFGNLDFKSHGIPDYDTYVTLYSSFRKIPKIDNIIFYQAFSLFRAACILQGVFKRATLGNASSSNAKQVGFFAKSLSDLAWSMAEKSSLPPTSTTTSSSNIAFKGLKNLSQESHSLIEKMLPFSPKYFEIKQKLLKFMDDEIYPAEATFHEQEKEFGAKWQTIPVIEELKTKAKKLGLWNLWITDTKSNQGVGLTNMEYAVLCEILGRSILLGPDATNCAAPDTGNMEVLMRYGTADQQKQWLEPLLSGEIRSGFAMTEPAVASSDATNICTEIKLVGDEYVINGTKWWTSGAGHPKCKILIVMGRTNPTAPAHQQQSMILVPVDTPGVKIVRPLETFGWDDAPHGHMEIVFENVRVPKSNILLGEGKGFEISQGRLGPGRIHHCMRLIGLTDRCLNIGTIRALNRKAFKKPIAFHGMAMESIAKSRIEVEQARLLTLKAAFAMDTVGNKEAKDLIAMIKIVAPTMACNVIDRMIQIHGAAGVSQDTILARSYVFARTLRLADGPDEVHIEQLAKLEYLKVKISNERSKL